jgi:hypothetical protein
LQLRYAHIVARIDACSCDTLTSVAGCYECGSFRVVRLGPQPMMKRSLQVCARATQQPRSPSLLSLTHYACLTGRRRPPGIDASLSGGSAGRQSTSALGQEAPKAKSALSPFNSQFRTFLEPIGRQLGIAHRVLNILVPQPSLQRRRLGPKLRRRGDSDRHDFDHA